MRRSSSFWALIAGFAGAVILLAAGGLLLWGSAYVHNTVQNQLVSRAQLAAGGAVGGLAAALLVANWVIRGFTDRRRLAAWDAEWLATGPRWSPRR